MRVNGFVCKDTKDVKVDDFFLAANLDKPRDTIVSKVGSNAMPALEVGHEVRQPGGKWRRGPSPGI